MNLHKNYKQIIDSLKISYKKDIEYDKKINNPIRLYIKNILNSVLSKN